RVTTRRSVVFLVSDFQAGGYETSLSIARRRHDVIPIAITDRREIELPDVGLIELLDAETGRTVVVDTSSKKLRRDYTTTAGARHIQREQMFHRMDIDEIAVMTGKSFVEPIKRFFRKREARR
ncbi:MAG: DUF58 domain-containing protein, partial [Planctomycetota bacterium]